MVRCRVASLKQAPGEALRHATRGRRQAIRGTLAPVPNRGPEVQLLPPLFSHVGAV